MSCLFLIGSSHRLVSAARLQRWSSCQELIFARLLELRRCQTIRGALLLSTCNRQEVLVECAPDRRAQVERAIRPPHDDPPVHVMAEEEAVRHLLRVATGLDSMAVGEDQILGQLRRAFQTAERHGLLSSTLRNLRGRLLAAAREIRERAGLARIGVSLSLVAARHLAPAGGRVAVVGAGETGRRAAEALLRHGAGEVLLVNRTYERAVKLARHLGCRAMRLDEFLRGSERWHGLLLALKTPTPVVGAEQAVRFDTIVDLSMPAATEPEVRELDGVRLIDLDEMSELAGQQSQQGAAVLRGAAELVHTHGKRIHESLDPRRRDLGAVIERHAASALSMLESELSGSLHHLSSGDREVLRRVAVRWAKRHAHFHIEDLKQAAPA